MKQFFEIITEGNRRPDYPEDNTVIIQAETLSDALDQWRWLRSEGKLLNTNEAISCRAIYYVYAQTPTP